MADDVARVSQCQKPRGWLGRLNLRRMNASHSRVTDWGLAHVSINKDEVILDVGCGGGRTVDKLAARASGGKVYGIDFAEESVAFTEKTNARWIEAGRVEVRHGSVSALPFADGTFDLVTAVETHFWWPDVPGGMAEIFRVLKAGGRLMVIAEIYRGADTTSSRLAEKYASKTGMKLLSVDEHRDLLVHAGFCNVEVTADPGKAWICAMGRKP